MPFQCKYQKCSFEGFEAFSVSNELIRLVVIPSLGGKIASLVDLSSGREWLWKNPYLAYREPVYGASYVREFDFGGIDECFPSVGPVSYPAEPWQGIAVPDHGEVWALPWSVEERVVSPEQITITMHCHGVRFPYRFERSITIEQGRARVALNYHVSNHSPFPLPFIWSIHPLIQVEPGMCLSMPGGATRARVDLATNDWLDKAGTLIDWPHARRADGSNVDLSILQPPSLAQGVKYFVQPQPSADFVETALTAVDGRLAFRFSPDEVTHIGIWMNCAGWTPIDSPPYYNLAFEPCIGGSDSLTTALDLPGAPAPLAPFASRRWQLDVVLEK